MAISLGILIFASEPHYQSVGIGMRLFSNLVTGLEIGFASSYASLLAGVSDTSAIILATVVASMAATMATEGTEQDRLLTPTSLANYTTLPKQVCKQCNEKIPKLLLPSKNLSFVYWLSG